MNAKDDPSLIARDFVENKFKDPKILNPLKILMKPKEFLEKQILYNNNHIFEIIVYRSKYVDFSQCDIAHYADGKFVDKVEARLFDNSELYRINYVEDLSTIEDRWETESKLNGWPMDSENMDWNWFSNELNLLAIKIL